ncbi:hypothetical protein DI270_018785, partial [Microbispora triticiradicis]
MCAAECLVVCAAVRLLGYAEGYAAECRPSGHGPGPRRPTLFRLPRPIRPWARVQPPARPCRRRRRPWHPWPRPHRPARPRRTLPWPRPLRQAG